MTGAEDQQWPPRSPFEAILSSPSGRKKLQQRHHRTSPSPSPVKRDRLAPHGRRVLNAPDSDEEMNDEEEEEDEETLQLKLQALEAKLKLKKLQNKKAKGAAQNVDADRQAVAAVTLDRGTSGLSRRIDATIPDTKLHRSKSAGDIQIPLSPERRPLVNQEQKSPGRVLLGIDKGLTAKHVSLRRAPSLRSGPSNIDPFGGALHATGARNVAPSDKYLSPNPQVGAPMSFNERMAQARNREQADKERHERLAKLQSERSSGFGISKEEIAAFKEAAASASSIKQTNASQSIGRGFSREEIVNAASKPTGGLVRRSNTVSSVRGERTPRTVSQLSDARPQSVLKRHDGDETAKSAQRVISEESGSTTQADPALFEGFSRTNLSTRILPHSFISRLIEDKQPATLPVLLREVKAPDFELPPELIEKDLVVFAIIAAKSEPRAHKIVKPQSKSVTARTAEEEAAASEANENGNYMVFTLTDLKWSIELFLFRTAYTRWNKLQPGTLIAILNPSIMPPQKARTDTGRWSLTLNSSEDTVLEIGTSKDLSWCKAKLKDGHNCSDWVDTRKTEFCEYHVNRGVEGLRRGRMEVQGMSAPFGPGGKSGGGNGYLNSFRGRKGQASNKDNGLLKEGRQFDQHSQSSYFMVSRTATAASLLDAEDAAELHTNMEERQRRMHAAEERERDIARKLAHAGSGAGAEYLRLRNGDVTKSSLKQPSNASGTKGENNSDAFDAKALGLRSNHASDVLLSPLKRKPVVKPINGINGKPEPGPLKKKTRFITEKGIREAGRDSLGGATTGSEQDGGLVFPQVQGANIDDDDELDIV